MTIRKRIANPKEFAASMDARATELLQGRGNLDQDDLEYVLERMEKMKDVRLKECIATLIGWGDAERGEIETMVAVLLEVAKNCNPSKIVNAAKTVELKYLIREHALGNLK